MVRSEFLSGRKIKSFEIKNLIFSLFKKLLIILGMKTEPINSFIIIIRGNGYPDKWSKFRKSFAKIFDIVEGVLKIAF